jgi:glutamine cyclotransferase
MLRGVLFLYVAVAAPDTGQVTGWIDLAELKSRMPPLLPQPLHPVMNGIAYDTAGRRLFCDRQALANSL